MEYIKKKLQKIDSFHTVHPDLKEKTTQTFLLSIICLILMIYFSLKSTFNFLLKKNQQSNFQIQQTNIHRLLQTNIKVSLYRIPCEIVSIDLADSSNTKKQIDNGLFNMKFQRIDKNGNAIDKQQYLNNYSNDKSETEYLLDSNQLLQRIKQEEGCKLEGYFFIDKVPGQFMINSNRFMTTIAKLAMEEKIYNLDFTHYIEELYFGTEKQKQQADKYSYYSNVDSLSRFYDSKQGLGYFGYQNNGIEHQFFLKVNRYLYIY